MKQCRKCGEWKPLGAYHKIQGLCKSCNCRKFTRPVSVAFLRERA